MSSRFFKLTICMSKLNSRFSSPLLKYSDPNLIEAFNSISQLALTSYEKHAPCSSVLTQFTATYAT
uniref:Uncharacterized protein n=1 Tax=Aegilops tauschii subsp. strangulata TaxID=200361 RepID=A0A452Z4X9_AEGTS